MADDLVATDIVAAADHDDNFCAAVECWFDLFGNPACSFVVEPAVVFTLELFTGEFEENSFIHSLSILRER